MRLRDLGDTEVPSGLLLLLLHLHCLYRGNWSCKADAKTVHHIWHSTPLGRPLARQWKTQTRIAFRDITGLVWCYLLRFVCKRMRQSARLLYTRWCFFWTATEAAGHAFFTNATLQSTRIHPTAFRKPVLSRSQHSTRNAKWNRMPNSRGPTTCHV